MNKFLAPAIALMEGMRYPVKLGMILTLFVLPLLVVGSLLLSEINNRSDFLKQERRGIEFIKVLRPLLESIPQHRGMTNAYLRGDKTFRDKIQSKRTEIDGHFEQLEHNDRRLKEFLQSNGKVTQLKQYWQELKAGTFNLSPEEAFASHNTVMVELIGLIRHIANTSGLVQDSELDSHYLIDAVIQRFPAIAEAMGQARGVAVGITAQGRISSEDQVRLNILLANIKRNYNALDEGLKHAYSNNAETQVRLGASMEKVGEGIKQFTGILRNDLLGVDRVLIKADIVFDSSTNALSSIFSLFDQTLPLLDELLGARVDIYSEKEYLALGTMGIVLLVMLYLFAGFYFSVLITINGLSGAIRRLTQGDLSARADISTRDEMSSIATGFNQMAETLQKTAERESEQLEQLREASNISERVEILREHIAKVAAGDLTQDLRDDNKDDLAQLATHLNTMTGGLANISNQILETSNSISSTLSEVNSATSSQSVAAAEQAAAVNETSTTLEEIKQTSATSLEKAQALGSSATRARQESELGLQAVEDTITGMSSIRERMTDIAETIMALSEQTQQIGAITDAVSSLAQQSKMLALNASIEAAKAGEAGKGFAVVAAEVKGLAEQSQQSTIQVQDLLQEIRHATDRAVMATEEGGKGVDAGVAQVQKAGDAVRQLGAVIYETATASEQIVASVRQEAAGIDQVHKAMSEINRATSQFVSSASQTEVAGKNLETLAEKLREGISVYKLK